MNVREVWYNFSMKLSIDIYSKIFVFTMTIVTLAILFLTDFVVKCHSSISFEFDSEIYCSTLTILVIPFAIGNSSINMLPTDVRWYLDTFLFDSAKIAGIFSTIIFWYVIAILFQKVRRYYKEKNSTGLPKTKIPRAHS